MGEAEVAVLHERLTNVTNRVAIHEAECERSKAAIFDRLRTIERLIYLGIGGLMAIGALATFFGWNILKMLGR